MNSFAMFQPSEQKATMSDKLLMMTAMNVAFTCPSRREDYSFE